MTFLRPSYILCATLCLLVSGVSISSDAQTLSQRMESFRKQRREQEARNLASQRALAKKANRIDITQAMSTPLPAVTIDGIAMRDAFDWLQEMTGVKIVVNWRSLEALGVDPEQQVSISGHGLTPNQVMKLLIIEFGPDIDMVVDATPWYIRVMTKEEANSRAVVRVYGIGDLLQRIPNFEEAPEFDLTQITQSSQGGAGSGGLFNDTQEDEPEKSKDERAADIATLIRETVEPDLWRENGGTYGSISVWRDMLIVRAPMYVQRQIGISTPMVKPTRSYGPRVPRSYSRGGGSGYTRYGRYVRMNMHLDSASLRTPMRTYNLSRRGSVRPTAGILPR